MGRSSVSCAPTTATLPTARPVSAAAAATTPAYSSAKSTPVPAPSPSTPSKRNPSTTSIPAPPVSPLPAQVAISVASTVRTTTSPTDVQHYDLTPEALVALCQQHHCPGIAYTYTEPLTYLEYITDCARLAHEAGLWNILVTAGYVCQRPLADLLPYLDAANIDLKSFSDDLYRRVSGGRLQPVLDTILAMRDAGVWIELTNLIIPQLTDNLDMIRQMCRWLVDHHLADAPLHFSRFFPRYRLPDTPPTPLSTLRAAQRIALDEGIQHVYLGNV